MPIEGDLPFPQTPRVPRDLRVVHVTPTFFSPSSILGGGERFVNELCKAQRKYVDAHIVSFGTGTNPVPDYIHIHRPLWHLGSRRVNPISVSFLPRLLKADIIHCHQVFTLITNQCQVIARLVRKKIFLTDLGGGGFSFYYGLRLHKLADGFISLSKHSAERFARTGKPSFVVYGGADPDLFRNLGKTREARVACVARVTPHKGQDVLIRALPKGLGLDIVGSIEHMDYFGFLRKIAADKDVKFLIGVDDIRLVEIYNSVLASVLPSVYIDLYGNSWLPSPELLGLSLLESMACETPVIASDAGGMPEVVLEGKTGFLVPPSDVGALADRLCWIRDNPEAVRQMGKESREWILSNFTWDKVAKRCLSAYSSVLASSAE